MTATVLRHHFGAKPYVCIRNEVARDVRLSFGARGLLVHMVSLPEGWRFSAERLSTGSPPAAREGRAVVQRYLRELEALGYVRRARERDAQGRVHTVTYVSDEPVTGWVEVHRPPMQIAQDAS